MTRIAGVLVILGGLYAALVAANPRAGEASNLIDVANRQGFYGVLTVGVGVLMVAGGIDLSMGSVVALGAVVFGTLMEKGVPPAAAAGLTCLCGVAIGLTHGLLVAGLKLQPFLVTLCGLFVYRGLARLVTDDNQVGVQKVLKGRPEFRDALEGLKYYLVGKSPDDAIVFPGMMAVFLALTLVLGAVLHFTVYGRYWYAIGYNEQAARYAGVGVFRQRVAGFVISSTCAAFAGVLFLLSYGTAKPDNAGQADELYAITGAVLGGVSLRGGEGTAAGMALGAMVLPLLRNLITFLEIPGAVEPAIIGLTLLVGVVVDEQVRGGSGLTRAVRRLFRTDGGSGAASG